MAAYSKRKKAKKTHRRRRRIGAMDFSAKSPLVKFGSIALGYFLGDKINTPIDSMVAGKVDSKVIAGGEVLIGGLLAFKGKPSLVKSLAGGVLLGAGVKRGMAAFGIGGFYQTPVIGAYRKLAGFHDTPVIGGKNGMGVYNPGPDLPTKKVGAYQVPAKRGPMTMNGCDDGGSGINPSGR